jgi:hypothetical protein
MTGRQNKREEKFLVFSVVTQREVIGGYQRPEGGGSVLFRKVGSHLQVHNQKASICNGKEKRERKNETWPR